MSTDLAPVPSTPAPATPSPEPGRRRQRGKRVAVWLGGVVVLLLAAVTAFIVVGFSVGSVGTTIVEDFDSPGITSAPDTDAGEGTAGPSDTATTGDPLTTDTLADQKLVRTADLSLRVDDLATAAAGVRDVAVKAGGVVQSERINSRGSTPVPTDATRGTRSSSTSPSALPPPRATNRGLLYLSVPSDRLDAVLTQLSELGTVTSRSSSSQDVSSTVADRQSRITTMRAGIDRLRALMDKTTAVDQLATLERELATRQAELASLEARLARLTTSVDMASVEVNLTADGMSGPTAQGDDTGFLAGLRSGWSAFVSGATWVLTGLGMALPFLGLVLVIGLGVLTWWRRHRRNHAAPTEQAASTRQPVPTQQAAHSQPSAGSEPAATHTEAE